MDRRDTYFKQLVTADDMDELFDLTEEAMFDYAKDHALVGVLSGMAVTETGPPSLNVEVAVGTAYDKDGQRIRVPSTQSVDVSQDSLAVSTEVVGALNSKIITIYVKFKRNLSNPQQDGNNVTVYYDVDQSFEFEVVQSAEAVTPTAPAAIADGLILADWTRSFGDTTATTANISQARAEVPFDLTAGSLSIQAGRIADAIEAMLNALNDHITDVGNAHDASAIAYDGGVAWADGTTNPSTDLDSHLDSMLSRLASTVDDIAGTFKIGGEANAGSPVSLSAGPLGDQLLELQAGINDHVADASAAHAASAISYTPAGNVSSTDVQDAITELDTEKGGLNIVNSWTDTNSFATLISTLIAQFQGTVVVRNHTGTVDELKTVMEFHTYADTFGGTGTPLIDTITPDDDTLVVMMVLAVQAPVSGAFGASTALLATDAFYKTGGTVDSLGGLYELADSNYDPLTNIGDPMITLVPNGGDMEIRANMTTNAGALTRQFGIGVIMVNVTIP